MVLRTAQLERKSKETEISVRLNIDGGGKATINTQIGILDHMLELFAFHGIFDLEVNVKKADTNIDIHHVNEDIGIVLGKAFRKALGEGKEGIKRFGSACAPMEDTLSQFVIDISGRGSLTLDVPPEIKLKPPGSQEGYTLNYMEHFLEAFAKNLGANINHRMTDLSDDLHTNLETVFKSFGIALDQATQIDPRRKGVPSTKGIIH